MSTVIDLHGRHLLKLKDYSRRGDHATCSTSRPS